MTTNQSDSTDNVDKRVTRSQIRKRHSREKKQFPSNKSGNEEIIRKVDKPPEQNEQHRNERKMPRHEIARIMIPSNMLPMIGPRCDTDSNQYCLSRNEERYLSSLTTDEREYFLKELRKSTSMKRAPIRFRVLQSNIPNKDEILQRLASSCDSAKFESWIESILALPIGKLAPPPIHVASEIGNFLKDTRDKMDTSVYGQHEAKDEILRMLCQWSSSGGLTTFAIALEGEPGIGKTTFAKNVIARVMNRPFNFISLGGATDAAHLTGHSYTYEGAIPGRIAESLKSSKVMNPCFYFDELDKISKTAKGDEITNLLVHLTDREQNSQFHDRYFHGIDLDLSQALFVFSYNFQRDISPVLMDRLNVVKLKPPSVEEKIQIAQRHLLPRALKESALSKDQIIMSDDCIEHIINNYTDESGVRNLEKALCRIVSTLNVILHAPNVLTTIDLKNSKKNGPLMCDERLIDSILVSMSQKCHSHLHMYS
tara:strand:+ start:6975 stop:8420 length:1446 start_codon:yes stop_codon:yes gene_type:complete